METNALSFKTEMGKKMDTIKMNMAKKAETFQKKLPDVKPLNDEIIEEGNKMYAEIQSDPTLKHICDAM